MDKTERSSDQVEDVNADKLSQHGGNLIMPASLAALSQEEYERVGKKATLKMDLVIMPIMVIMYIRECSPRIPNIFSQRTQLI